MKSRKNPYAQKLKKPVTICLGEDVIGYFKGMAEDTDVPYQSLINLYLRDYAAQHKKRVFCSNCGSPLYSQRTDMPEIIRLRLGTVTDEHILDPNYEIYCRVTKSGFHGCF